MQSKIHKYRYRYVDTYAHTWPHDDAEQHVASFPSRKDNEIVFAQEPWTDSLSATAAAPPKPEQLFREIDNYAKKKGEKGKKRKCEKHSKENSREVQLNLLLFAHTWKDFTEFCELRDWLKYLFNVVVLSVLVVVVIDNKLNSLWEVHQFHQIWSDYAPLTSCSKL